MLPLATAGVRSSKGTPQRRTDAARLERLHGLDALRVFATLLVVVMHAAIPYLIEPLPGLAWPTRDRVGSPAVDALFWWVEGFIMPLFFLIAGFFAAGLLEARGARAFVVHRTKRLLLPLLLGCVIILPLDLYVWLLGWAVDGKIPLSKLRSLKFDATIDEQLWGLSHLWFLQYLYLYCLGYVGLSWLSRRLQQTRADRQSTQWFSAEQFDRLLLWFWKPVVLAVPCAAVLWFAPEVVTGFQHGFLPFAPKFLYTIPFFATGLGMHRYKDSLGCFVRHSGIYLALSAVAFMFMLPLVHEHLSAELTGIRRAALIGSITLFAWLTSFGLFGLFLEFGKRSNAVICYSAEASFWVYLAHHPVVGLTQVVIAAISLPLWMKFFITTTTALVFSLLTYYALVRYSWLGAVLNGRRKTRSATRPDLQSIPHPRSVTSPALPSGEPSRSDANRAA